MNILEAIYARRSIRKYEDRPVEREKLVELVKAATAAPTAMNARPWHFIIVDEKEEMDGIRGIMRFGKHNAPAAIVVCGNMKRALPAMIRDFWVQDCSAAVENICLGAMELELGTVWLGVTPVQDHVEKVSAYLGLPKHIIPLGIIYVGYPAEEKEPRTQFKEENISYQRMGEQRKPKNMIKRALEKKETPKGKD